MSYLLDTNVLSEFVAQQPDANLIRWISQHQDRDLYISVISVGELQQGISRLPASKKRSYLENWLQNRLLVDYQAFILPLDQAIMLHWGQMMAELNQQGRPMPIMDSLIAATAQWHSLVLVSRNTADFAHVDLEVVNPWLNIPPLKKGLF